MYLYFFFYFLGHQTENTHYCIYINIINNQYYIYNTLDVYQTLFISISSPPFILGAPNRKHSLHYKYGSQLLNNATFVLHVRCTIGGSNCVATCRYVNTHLILINGLTPRHQFFSYGPFSLLLRLDPKTQKLTHYKSM